MSRFLHIECEPVDQPAATDPVERATWSSLRIKVGARTVSRVLDSAMNDERSLLFVPAFPIAEWIVDHWWSLLNEPCRTELIPNSDADEPHFSWMKRHCLRASASDLLLPALYLYNDGRSIRAEWQADPEGSLPHMPGEFVDSGGSALDNESTSGVLAQFVANVLSRVGSSTDGRVTDLRDNWQAIQNADKDERDYCTVAGRMGLDPYDPEQIDADLSAFIESISDADSPLIRDLTTVAQSEVLLEQWNWSQAMATKYRIGPARRSFQTIPATGYLSAAKFGYSVAAAFRENANVPTDGVLDSVEDIAKRAFDVSLRVEDQNHLPGHGVRLIAGWTGNDAAVLAGPRQAFGVNERFSVARGLYQIAVSTARGPRLVTDAFTWDQQASRAFAAELIAPREALKSRIRLRADSEIVRELATEFKASTILIEKQLKNARVPVVDE